MKKEWDKAEIAYKKATEIKPDYVEAWNGLANAYNSQKKLDLALEASANAAKYGGSAAGGAGSANSLYNQGVILFNQQKYAEAKEKFAAAVAADPNYADGHYQLAMSSLNTGDMPGAISAPRGVPEGRPDWPARREGEGVPQGPEEVAGTRRRVVPDIAANLAAVRGRLEQAARTAGRNPSDIRLVAISKNFPQAAVRAAFVAGQVDFGENRVQEALQKIRETAELHTRWHLVGHLQTNKARRVAGPFAYIHSIDSLDLLRMVDEAAATQGASPKLLIQVDLAGEATSSAPASRSCRRFSRRPAGSGPLSSSG